MRRLIESLVSHTVLANVLLVSVVIGAILAVGNMRRESMPEFSLNMLQVEIPYPGSEPQEVEEGINRRVESVLDGMVGIKEYHTYSREGIAFAVIEVDDDQDLEKMKDRVRSAIDGIATFPADAETPRIVDLKEEEEVINIALWGELPERQLKEWAERIRAELQRNPAISQVVVADTRGYEISVEVSRERLLQYGMTMEEVSRAIRDGSRNYSSGSIKAASEEISIRSIGKRYDGREFEEVVVRAAADGNVIRLKDIATVRDGFTEYPAYGRFNGKPCVLLELYKVDGEDSIAISDAVYAYTRATQPTLPEGLHMSPCFDESKFVRTQISMLLSNGFWGLLLVLAILLLFLDTRLSIWVAMGIPISVGGALIIMWVMDATINQISLMAFIIVLGIIVDDAIVVSEAIFYHRKNGLAPMDAAIAGVSEVGMPVVAAVLTTIVAFLPGLFVPGFMGQIVALLPVVVIAALAVSLVECLFLLPAHLNNLPGPEDTSKPKSGLHRFREFMSNGLRYVAESIYLPLVRRAVTHRYVTCCFAISTLLVTAGLIGGNYLRIVMWPPADGNNLAAFVEFPVGTPSEVTRDALAQMEAALLRVSDEMPTTSGEPLVQNIHSRVFQGVPSQGRVYVEMPNPSKRGVHSQDISTAWEKEVGVIPGVVELNYYKSSIGDTGAAINIWFQGGDMGALRVAADTLKEKLRGFDGVYQIEDSFRPGKNELQVTLKPAAHAAGLRLDDVASFLRAGYYGEEALRFQRGRDDVKVRVRYPQEERKTLSELENTLITAPDGKAMPLMAVADFAFAQGYASISGSNGMRRLAVFAEVDTNITTAAEVIGALEDQYLDTLVAGFADMHWSVHGASQRDSEMLDSLLRGFGMAMLVIFIILSTVFRSYLQPFVILVVVPFGIVGAAIGHLVLGIPLSFLSLFGIVALSGVVVNDAIVLIECINAMLAKGIPFYTALTEGGVRRFRAIFLTTASTSAGLAPLLMETDFEAQIVIPMATSIAFGVVFATVLTLLVIPALLGILNDGRRLSYRLRHGNWPTPEAVEPALTRGNRTADDGMEPTALLAE